MKSLALAAALAIVASPVCARSGSPARITHVSVASSPAFALLPLVAGDPGVPYAIFPSAEQRSTLGTHIVRDLERTDSLRSPRDADITSAIARAGFDQNDAYRACQDAECARSIGRALHVDSVIYGSVTRYLAMIWGSEVSIVDVRSGRVSGPYELGYKGDYDALEMGIGELSATLSRTLSAGDARHGSN